MFSKSKIIYMIFLGNKKIYHEKFLQINNLLYIS